MALEILDWFYAIDAIDDIESELEKLCNATMAGEIDILIAVNPKLTSHDHRVLNWESLQLTYAVDGTYRSYTPQPTPEQWADYFIYWKSLDILPREKQTEFLKVRNEQLYPKYYSIVMSERDSDKDGRLKGTELLDPNNLRAMLHNGDIIYDGKSISAATPLTEETAMELLRHQPRPQFFGLRPQ